MTPPSKAKVSPRNRTPFNVREIVLYGIPFWIGSLVVGWYVDGWLGLKSSIVGLLILSVYVGSAIIIAKKTRRTSAGKTVALAVAGFWARLVGLWLLVYVLYNALNLNLLVLLLTIAFGFTVILAISTKNWLLG